MRSIKILFALAILPFCAIAQNITGDWYGTLKAGSQKMRLVFHITKTDSGYLSTMDSPNQGANGMPVTTTIFQGSKLKLKLPSASIEYNGELKDTIVIGTFKQGGFPFPLNLSRKPEMENQDVSGDWFGKLNTQGISLRVVFHINKTDDYLALGKVHDHKDD